MPPGLSAAPRPALTRAYSAPDSNARRDPIDSNAPRERLPRPQDVEPAPALLYSSERKRDVAIDPSTLRIIGSPDPEEKFRRLPPVWPSNDPAVKAVMGRRGAYIDPKGKVVCERGSDAHRAGLAALKELADASGKTIQDKKHGASIVTAALASVGLVTTLTGGNIVLGILAGVVAAIATTIYLNGRDHLSTQYAMEMRLKRFEETGKLDAATSLSERLAHKATGPWGRLAARFLASVLGDARDAVETQVGNLARGVINAPPASSTTNGDRIG